MDGFSMDDLKQLFCVTHDNEYIYLNICLLNKLKLQLDKVSVSDNLKLQLSECNIKTLKVFDDVVKKLTDYDRTKYSMPNVLDITINGDRDVQLEKIKELYNNYNIIVNLLNDSLLKMINSNLEVAILIQETKQNCDCALKNILTSSLNNNEVKGEVNDEVNDYVNDEVKDNVELTIENKKDIVSSGLKINNEINSPVEKKENVSLSSVKLVIDNNKRALETFNNNCNKLEADRKVVLACIENMNTYKSNGLNVEGALGPLNEQMTSIQQKIDNYIKSVMLRLDELNKEINNFESTIKN